MNNLHQGSVEVVSGTRAKLVWGSTSLYMVSYSSDQKQWDSLRLKKLDWHYVCKRVLIDDNVKETVKKERYCKLQKVSRRSDTFIYDVKGKKTSGTSWFQGIPRLQCMYTVHNVLCHIVNFEFTGWV